jgi:O-antigen biosynthesis protein WbqP
MRSKRIFDIILSIISMIVLAIPFVVIGIAVWITSPGPIIYWSERVARNNSIFWMPKFRSMQVNAPVVATHLLIDPAAHLTVIGPFLRRNSLDELPQLWSILRGHMSFVGPRPALYNQTDLIALRNIAGVHLLAPGITGWAQINGRDELSIAEKVALDVEYLSNYSFWLDIKILSITIIKVLRRDGVVH